MSETKTLPIEAAIEPELEICDPHHHLWDVPGESSGNDGLGPHRTFLLPDLLAVFEGHRVTSTIFAECGTFYRADGPAHLKPVGETEFANGVAAMAASGRYGEARIAEGVIAHVDLRQGERAVVEALEAHLSAAGSRFVGIRQSAADDPTGSLPDFGMGGPQLYGTPQFREGFARFAAYSRVFDAWIYHPQIGELADLARAFPDQTFVLDHVGTPIGVGTYADQRDAAFADWKRGIADLAGCPNATVKIGGMGMYMLGLKDAIGAGSEMLAKIWAPYIETTIEAFGVERCMFESNFPVDGAVARYGTIWNCFKRIAAGYSASEKAALFRDNARRIYGLDRTDAEVAHVRAQSDTGRV